MKTDEELAKEYADHESDEIYYTVKAAVLHGLKKGRDIEAEKGQRFAEWTQLRFWHFNTKYIKWFQIRDSEFMVSDLKTTSELYNSPEFLEWYKQFEK
jgi:hypothetical protein